MSQNAPSATVPRESKIVHHHLFRLLHWIITLSFLVLFFTGIQIHCTARPEWSIATGHFPHWMPGGRVMLIHWTAALLFAPSLLAMLWLFWRRAVRRRAVHYHLLLGGLVMLLTGLFLTEPWGGPDLYQAMRMLHAAGGLLVLPLAFLWHVIYGLCLGWGALVMTFHPAALPRWRAVLWFVLLILLSAYFLTNGRPHQRGRHELVAPRIDAPITQPSEMAGLDWSQAPVLDVPLAEGANLPHGRTDLQLQAMHNGRELFVKARWFDPTESRQYTPWKRTAAGWVHLEDNPKDETVFYEDKFSLVFPIGPNPTFEHFGCAATCHAGADQPYGFKASSRPIDVWHWKSTRTDPVGQVDDKYWAALDPENKDFGRFGDPKTGGGYDKNVDKKDDTHPKLLPPHGEPYYNGALPADEGVPYDETLAAAIPEGQLVPGIIVSEFQGDRGDVRCFSQYADQHWTLYMMRRLDTESEHDAKFVPGGSISFACAAFNQAAKRHAFNHAVYQLRLEP